MEYLQKILELLISQIGYKESGTNITKYAKYFDTPKSEGGAWQFFNTKKQGAEWCALLLIWTFCQILGTEKTREFLGLPKPADNCAAGCKFFFQYLEKKGYKVGKSEGQPGSIVFFNTKNAKCGHVGMIEKVDDNKYYTIEGNKSNSVKRCSYVKNSTTIYAICNLPYDQLETASPAPAEPAKPEEPAPEPKPEPKPAPAPAPEKPKATIYKVKTNSGLPLRLRAEPNTSSPRIASIKNGSSITVTEIVDGEKINGNKSWAKTTYNGKTGYCSMAYLK